MFKSTSPRLVAASLFVAVLLIVGGALAATRVIFDWRQGTKHWTVQVTNQRSAELLVAGLRGPMSEDTGYAILDAGASATADISHQDAPPEVVVFDFASHKGPNGELVVVPAWKADHRAVVCPWDEIQRYQPVVVTDDASSCADLAPL